MRVFEFTNNDLLTMDTLRGLRDETVEIWEHQTVHMMDMDEGEGKTAVKAPRLVIEDDFTDTRLFIAKARGEYGLLSELLGKRKS